MTVTEPPGGSPPAATAASPAGKDGAHPSVAAFARHVNPAFVKLLGVLGYGRVLVKARGELVFDDRGREYLDFLAGFGAVNLGHNHPRLMARLKAFADESPLGFCHVGPSAPAAALAQALAARLPAPLSVSLFSSSGAEAVEAGLKLARAATGRTGLVYCRDSFHGTNLGTLSVMGSARMRRPFEPLLAGCQEIPFGDLPALSAALAMRDRAAFVVEPIQAEGGIVLPAPGYLARAQELCRQAGTLLVLDEVQTGLGRTGRMFAFEAEGFTPDVLVLAKALSGGHVPIGATITSPEHHGRAYGSLDRFDLHGSTFGGNALSCAMALETLSILDDEGLVARAAERGTQLLALLREKLAGHPLVRDVRGRGLLIGIELGPTDSGWLSALSPRLVAAVSRHVFGQWASLRLLERGLLCQPASQAWNVLRLEPPLTVTREQIERAAQDVVAVLSEYRGLGPLLKDVGERLGEQWLSGWGFR